MAKILVVEDEQTIVELLQILLEDEGYRVIKAGNGRAALACLKEERVDLVLSDIMMPYMDGWQLCRELSTDPAFRNLPVILMSAAASFVPPDETCRFAALIEKPFEVEKLLQTLAWFLKD